MRLPIFSLSLLLSLDIFGATELLRTIKPSGQGGDYTSLSAWEAATQKDLVASDEFAVAEIDGDWSGGPDTTSVLIDGWTTDATHYIEVRTTATARHDGKWNASKYVLSSAINGNVFRTFESFTHLIGLQVMTTTTTGSSICYYINNSSGCSLVKCLARGNTAKTNASFYSMGIYNFSINGLTVINCASFDHVSAHASSAGFYGDSDATFLNCTAYNSNAGFKADSTVVIAKNCLAQSCTTDFTGTFDASSTNNCSEDGTAPNTNEQTGTITFTDAANGDFGLVSGVAIANGADLSGTFTDDIAGVTRTVPWDIGARKYVSAGGGMVLLPTGLLQ